MLSFTRLAPGLLARLVVFHDPPFSSYGRKKEASERSDSLGLLNLTPRNEIEYQHQRLEPDRC